MKQYSPQTNRFFSMLLSLAMVLGLMQGLAVTARAAEQDNGYLSFETEAIDGNGNLRGTGKVAGSITASVLMSNHYDGTIVKDRSTTQIRVYPSYFDMSTGRAITDDEVYVAISTDSPIMDPWNTNNHREETCRLSDVMSGAPDGNHYFVYNLEQHAEDTVIYFTAGTAGGSHYAAFSVDFKHQYEAISNIRYTQIGMQVRVVDDIPLGPNDYYTSQSQHTTNNSGLFTGSYANSAKTYTGLDGKQYPDCYIDIRTHNDDALSGDGRIINIDEVQDWINNKYLPALQAAGRELPDSVIKVSGPAYIMMYNGTIDGPKTKVERTNLEYYTKPGSNAANAYAGWGPNTKDDFIKLRYVSLIIPLQQNGRITINCYDEESGELLFTTTKIPEQKYTPIEGKDIFERAMFYGPTAPYSLFLEELTEKLRSDLDGERYMNALLATHDSLWEKLHAFEYNATTHQLDTREIEGREDLETLFKLHQKTLKRIKDTTPPDEVSAAISVTNIKFPNKDSTDTDFVGIGDRLKGYKFDYGIAMDALFPASTNKAVPILNDKTQMNISVSQVSRDVEVDLYYLREGGKYTVKVKINGVEQPDLEATYTAPLDTVIKDEDVKIPDLPDGVAVKDIEGTPLTVDDTPDDNVITINAVTGGKYTVKVVIDGVEQPSLQRECTAPVGTVIRDDDVDKSVVPSGVTVTSITGTPLTIDNTPDDNIIIINATRKENGTIIVKYYLDGILDDTYTFTLPIGASIGTAPANPHSGHDYSDYTKDRETGTPLIVKEGDNHINVYYKKNPTPSGSISGDAKVYLFDLEKYYNSATYSKAVAKYKSGYGFWARVEITVPDWLGKLILRGEKTMETKSWATNTGCSGPGSNSKTLQKYILDSYTCKATWTEGLTTSGTSKAGTKVTKDLVLDKSKSTNTKLVFKLPVNPNSANGLEKAYIPVGWKDKTYWSVEVQFDAKYQELWWKFTDHTYNCGGHYFMGILVDGPHVYGYQTEQDGYTQDLHVRRSGKATVYIDGNMYEDDFTGDRR